MITSRKRAVGRLSIAIAATVASVVIFAPASAGAASVTCRASALRVGSIEPSVANASGDPCRTGQGSAPASYGFSSGALLRAVTEASGARSGTASSDVGRLEDDGLLGPAALRLLGSDAYVACHDGKPVVVGDSEIAGGEAGGLLTTPTGLRQNLNLGGVIILNEATTSGHTSTYRALHVATPLGDIVAGESQAGYTGNPC